MPHARHRVVLERCRRRRRRPPSSASRASSRRPTSRARRGSRSCADADGARRRRSTPRAGSRASSVVLVEELVAGPEVTVNAFSVGGRFHPLTVTDRVVADPPAFGVALAHVWPSELRRGDVEAAARASPRRPLRRSACGTGRRTRRCSSAADGPRVGELAARLGGGHDAELCDAALGVDLNQLDDRGRARRADLRGRARPGRAGRRRVRALPRARAGRARGGRGARRRRRGRAASSGCGATASRATSSAPLRRGADRAGAVLAVGDSRKEAVDARASARRPRIRFVTAEAEALV